MAKTRSKNKVYKLNKGQKIGALAAETDRLLEQVFIDTGDVDILFDPTEPRFLLLGRTGSGKTAILQHIKNKYEHNSQLNPDELSMQYLHNNSILKTIVTWGVHLDIFYKFLWRHILILELIKLRYNGYEGVENKFFDWLKNNLKKTKSMALRYLEEHGKDYWLTADTHIKNLTTDLETSITTDNSVGARLGGSIGSIDASTKEHNEDKFKEHLEVEIKPRVQKIVNDYQVAALKEVIEELSKHGFNDDKKKYCILIDDLDNDWMPDDIFYSDLIKSLLFTVKEINHRLRGVKILVAMRTNIYYRVFRKTRQKEPQREKWLDVTHELKWSKEELVALVNKRLAVLLREQYTHIPPTLTDILPQPKKRINENAIDYLIDRTLYRPRDILDFLNTCFDQNDGNLILTWSKIEQAEVTYSRSRLNAITDEWKDSYPGIPILYKLLQRRAKTFTFQDISEEDLYEPFSTQTANEFEWLISLQQRLIKEGNINSIKVDVLQVLYTVGLIGIKKDSHISFSYEKQLGFLDLTQEQVESCSFYIHKMCWKALEIKD